MKNSNFPIHPILDLNQDLTGMCGLTKREYFAGLAMQGMLANPKPNPDSFMYDEIKTAKWAIGMADALLSELEKPQQ